MPITHQPHPTPIHILNRGNDLFYRQCGGIMHVKAPIQKVPHKGHPQISYPSPQTSDPRLAKLNPGGGFRYVLQPMSF